jgi:hypothetical protein
MGCRGVLLSRDVSFSTMCISWMVPWLHVFWWPVCADLGEVTT